MQFCKSLSIRIFSFSTRNPLTASGSIHVQPSRYVATVNEDFYTYEPVKVAEISSKIPKEQTRNHVGMWYTLDPAMVTRLYQVEGLTKKHKDLNSIIGETSFIIREPALSVIEYAHKSNLENPPNKFILYGRNGSGKTVSLAHIAHHFVEEQWIIVQVCVPARWIMRFKEINPSTSREGFYDHTLDASIWLQQFRTQNEVTLKNPELVTSERYQWTQREATEAGSSLLSLVDFGINRARYASDCVYALNAELKKNAREGRIKVAVIIDGINSLFSDSSAYFLEDKTMISAQKFTLIQAFLQMVQNDWKNAIITGSVDTIMSPKERRKSFLPRYLLGKKGWEALDPFIPIKVDDYTDAEAENAINYYIDRKWLQHPGAQTREGKDELIFLSGKNPGELVKLINSH